MFDFIHTLTYTDCGGKVVAVTAAAGESWDGLVAESVHRGLYGIENLSGIPGTVGAAPIQNIGAYGAEVADVIASVEAMDMRSGARVSFLPGDCAFGYRDSFFKTPAGGNFIITAVTFQLSAQGAPNIEYRDIREYIAAAGITAPSLAEIREAVLAIRSRKFPDLKAAGTAGSFFKNPVVTGEECVRLTRLFPGLPSFPLSGGKHKIALGWLLERLGWKGVRRGAAGVFERQALVLVNYGGATAAEVAALAAGITHDVKKKTNLTIAPEIVYVGGA